MNGQPFPQPPAPQTLTLEGIINLRIGLDQIKHDSKEIKDSKAKLDSMIFAIISSFQTSVGTIQ